MECPWTAFKSTRANGTRIIETFRVCKHYGFTQPSAPDGLRNVLEYSARTAEFTKNCKARRIRSEICRPDSLHCGKVKLPWVVELSQQSTDSTRRRARTAGHRSVVLKETQQAAGENEVFDGRDAKLSLARKVGAA